MERSPDAAAVPARAPQATPAAQPTPPAPAAPAVVPTPVLAPGDVLQATVLTAGDGRARLQWQGAVLDAFTALPLRAGETWSLRVAAVQPQIVLTSGRAVPSLADARLGGMLGPDAAAWLQPLRALVAGVVGAGEGPAHAALAGSADPGLQVPLRLLLGAAPAAEALRALHGRLGHDQEARVLRLPPAPTAEAAPEVAALRRTAKAAALTLLAEPEAPGEPAGRRSAAAELVAGLGRIERDNAARAEQGLPQWLPLPAVPHLGLRDARLFWAAGGDGGGGEAGARPFTIVLLLDLSRLGELRVDVALRGDAIDATFTAVRPAAALRLQEGLDDLRQGLTAAGLAVGALRVRHAPGARLPVADLVLRPRDLDALVDLHA